MASHQHPPADARRDNGIWLQQFNRKTTRLGRLWAELKRRCVEGGAYQRSRPTYRGCTNDFMNFQAFAAWATAQPGYESLDSKGKFFQLDKDLLVPGNRSYAEDTCCFVPASLNSLLVACDARRGEYPVGVCRDKATDSYIAHISKRYIGRYPTPVLAHQAWQRAKIEAIREAASALPPELHHLQGKVLQHADLIANALREGKETVRGASHGDV